MDNAIDRILAREGLIPRADESILYVNDEAAPASQWEEVLAHLGDRMTVYTTGFRRWQHCVLPHLVSIC